MSPLRKKDITVNVALGAGKANAVVYTSDLTLNILRLTRIIIKMEEAIEKPMS